MFADHASSISTQATITNDDSSLPVNNAPVITPINTGSVAENAAITTVIYTAVATDVDAGDTRSYSLKAASGDGAMLNIDATTGVHEL